VICSILSDPAPLVTPMCAHMLECERRDGRSPITPDNCPAWINTADWRPWPVLSIANGELHIVAVNAAVEGQGALKRLIAGAIANDLTPVIVEPMGATMPAILRKWGWSCTVSGGGWNAREEWRAA
jgi:hypothetical protein